MEKNEILEKLNKFNDPKFKFEEKEHKYTYGNDIEFISATTIAGFFKSPFDREGISKYVAERDGRKQEDILEEWDNKRIYSEELGTYIHEYIENYYNKIYQKLPTDLDLIDRINKFNKIHAEKLHKLEPIAFEKKVFDLEENISGTIDALFMYKGKAIIVDWKTNKEIKTDEDRNGRYRHLINENFKNVYENHLNIYSIQLSIYRRILEKAGIEVGACYIVYLPPKPLENGIIYKGKDFRDNLNKVFENKCSTDLKKEYEEYEKQI